MERRLTRLCENIAAICFRLGRVERRLQICEQLVRLSSGAVDVFEVTD